MQKYVLVKFLEPISDGFEFTVATWPLHVTLAPRFATEWSKNLTEKLTDLLAAQPSIETVVGDDIFFGPDETIEVTLVAVTPELQALHVKLIELLENYGATFDEPQYNKENYRAHISVQKAGRAKNGDKVQINELTLVDMFPGGDIRGRKVLKTFQLSR